MDRELTKSEKMAGRAVGFIAFSAGIGLFVFLVWMISKLMNLSRSPDTGALIFVGLVIPIAVFCVNVGIRMTMDRPNAYKSILSPISWAILGVIFISGSVFFAYLQLNLEDSNMLEVIATTLLLGAACMYKVWRVNRNAEQSFNK